MLRGLWHGPNWRPAEFGIEKAYGSYQELLADRNVDAVYIPLPNHLHVRWSMRALSAKKHVLCEKPIGLSVAEAEQLAGAAAAHPKLKVMEAFMYRFHPQWQAARQFVREGRIGQLRTIHTHFSYYNDDPQNIRNQADIGGGALMDIGCYPISLSRFIFDAEPQRVLGHIERDPALEIDRLVSAVLEFFQGTSTFTCSTQLVPHQRVNIFGTSGRIEIEIPFNAPPDRPCRVWLQIGTKPGTPIEELTFASVRPIHAPGRRLRPRDPRRHARPHAAGRRRRQHARHRARDGKRKTIRVDVDCAES